VGVSLFTKTKKQLMIELPYFSDSLPGKYCGIGPVGFPSWLPAVAERAVSLKMHLLTLLCWLMHLPPPGNGLNSRGRKKLLIREGFTLGAVNINYAGTIRQ
jgi:hypothetical protein